MSLIRLKDKAQHLWSQDYNRDILILGCGPSLNDFTSEKLDKISKLDNHKIVIAIKQAIFKYPFSDILCLNTCNISDYSQAISGDNWETHTVFQLAPQEILHYNLSRYDTVLPIVNVNNFGLSLSNSKDLDRWNMNATNLRCWGPGLIYETVFYLCHYLGAKNVYTIGWDLGTSNDGRDHFYKDEYFIHNKAQPLEAKETLQEVELSKLFYEWLKSKNINLQIASENSHAHKDIPRVKL